MKAGQAKSLARLLTVAGAAQVRRDSGHTLLLPVELQALNRPASTNASECT